MQRSSTLQTRVFSFAIAAFMDGMLGFVILAAPLLAIRLGADAWQLGVLGWFTQLVRVPFTLYSGVVSDRIGRTRVMYPAAMIGVAGCVGLVYARSFIQVLVCFSAVMVSMGGFYPSLMAFIGDRSRKGELRKNLSFFNAGWASSCSVCGLMVGVMLSIGPSAPFAAGAVLVASAMFLVFLWNRLPAPADRDAQPSPEADPAPSSPGPLLLVARVGLFLTVFGFEIVAGLFPKLGKELAMSDSRISIVVGMILVGQAAGILIAGAGAWWRGKMWPQMVAQAAALAANVAVFYADSDFLFGAAFLLLGLAVGVTYTSALYYGLQARIAMGRNTGIHESLIAVGVCLGGLAGGATGQMFTLRAPYLVAAIASGVTIAFSLAYWRMAGRPARGPART